VERFKRRYLASVLQHTGGVKKDAAELLEIQPTYLSRLLRKLGVDEP
jgi:DNA-binding NtrC family response regulator